MDEKLRDEARGHVLFLREKLRELERVALAITLVVNGCEVPCEPSAPDWRWVTQETRDDVRLVAPGKPEHGVIDCVGDLEDAYEISLVSDVMHPEPGGGWGPATVLQVGSASDVRMDVASLIQHWSPRRTIAVITSVQSLLALYEIAMDRKEDEGADWLAMAVTLTARGWGA